MSYFDSLQDDDLSEARARVEALMAQPDATASLDNALAASDASEIRKRHMASTTPERESKRLRAKFDERRAEMAGQSVSFLTKAADSAPLESADLPAPHITCSRCGQMKHEHEMAKKGKGVLRSFCKACAADKSKVHYDATRKAVPLTKEADSAPPESWSDRVDRHHREMKDRNWSMGLLPVPADGNYISPVGQANGWLQELTHYVGARDRMVALQIARLCGHDSEVIVPHNSLADAVGRSKGQMPNAVVDAGLKSLIRLKWITVEQTPTGKRISLTVGKLSVDREMSEEPLSFLGGAAWHRAMSKEHPAWYAEHYSEDGEPHVHPVKWSAGRPAVENEWTYVPTASTKKKRTKKDGTKFELSGTWLSDAEMDVHIRSCYTQCDLCDGDVR